MAIVKMSEFTLFAFQSQKIELLSELEKFGEVQFSDIVIYDDNLNNLVKDSEDKDLSYLQGEILKIKYSLGYINKYIPKGKGFKALLKEKKSLSFNEINKLVDKSHYTSIYNELKKIDEAKTNLTNQSNKLKTEIDSLCRWIKFDASFQDLYSLKGTVTFLGTISKNYCSLFLNDFNNYNEVYYEIIGEFKEGCNIFLLYHESIKNQVEELIKKYGINKVNFSYEGKPADIISDHNLKIEDNNKKILSLENRIKEYSQYINKLQTAYEFYDLEILKRKSCNNFLKTDKVIAARGWIPDEEKDHLTNILNNILNDDYSVSYRTPQKNENVPILLKNNFFAEPYEVVTSTYSLPSYGETDPTPILAPFFFIFFGMMFSDAGYGLVVFIAATLAIKLMPLDYGTKRFMRLFQSVGISTIIFGIIFGSYFGDAGSFIVSGGIKPLWTDPSKDPINVLVVCLFMGIIHLYTGLGIKAYELIKEKKYFSALFDVGFWYMTLSGCILLLVNSSLNIASLGTASKYTAILGAAGLVLTQGRENKGIIKKLAGGLYGLYGITGYVGDILSYSRLLALGLATGLIGSSFNLMIRLLPSGIATIIFGTVIFLFGHIFNLLINILGAYVHSSRLQYLEFFGKFFTGGGKPFKPLKPNNIYINVIKD